MEASIRNKKCLLNHKCWVGTWGLGDLGHGRSSDIIVFFPSWNLFSASQQRDGYVQLSVYSKPKNETDLVFVMHEDNYTRNHLGHCKLVKNLEPSMACQVASSERNNSILFWQQYSTRLCQLFSNDRKHILMD